MSSIKVLLIANKSRICKDKTLVFGKINILTIENFFSNYGRKIWIIWTQKLCSTWKTQEKWFIYTFEPTFFSIFLTIKWKFRVKRHLLSPEISLKPHIKFDSIRFSSIKYRRRNSNERNPGTIFKAQKRHQSQPGLIVYTLTMGRRMREKRPL